MSHTAEVALVDRVIAEYADRNPDVVQARHSDPMVAAVWHVVTELVRDADAVLRAWSTPHGQRIEMHRNLLQSAFGTADRRHGVELLRRLAEADERRLRERLLPVELVMPSSAQCTIAGVPWRYEGGEWKSVDTPADGE